MRPAFPLLLAAMGWGSVLAQAATLQVGPGRTYTAPCAAIAAASAGDTIEIDAGLYLGDVCAWNIDNLTIRGVGGRAHIDAAGRNSQGKGIWVASGRNLVVENIEFSGAAVPGHNGAGIRAQGQNWTVRNCYFHDNEEGILESNVSNSNILIEYTEFARNGYSNGQSHNLYIGNTGPTGALTFRYNYSHDANTGHLLKTRAGVNYILYNRITGESGTDSYEIDLPNGGTSYVIGNLIQQSAATGNSTILTYMEEGANARNPGMDLYVINNTFVNQRPNGGTFVRVDARALTAPVIQNNIFSGPGTVTNRADAVMTTNFVGNPLFVDMNGFDYHLTAASPAIDAGTQPGAANGFQLTPTFQYVHTAQGEARPVAGPIDIGAYEYPDTEPPAITINVPAEGAAYYVGSVVAADYSCNDGTRASSGVATCSGPVASGTPIDTASLGAKTFTVTAADHAGNGSSLTRNYVVASVPTVTVAGVSPASVQWSDKVVLTATVSSGCPLCAAGPIAGTVTFHAGAVTLASGVPVAEAAAGKAVAIVDPALTAGSSYPVTATFSSANPNYLGSGSLNSAPLSVTKEDASGSFDSGNPASVRVAAPGGSSLPFSIKVWVKESYDGTREPNPADAAMQAPGDIAMASVGMTLVPVGPGGPVAPAGCSVGSATGSGYGKQVPVTCSFSGVPVNTYSVIAQVGGDYYAGTAEDVVAVYDPSLGFATGGGFLYWPGTANAGTGYPGDRTNFGFTTKYNKGGDNAKGSVLAIRHRADGSIVRLKSNAMGALSLGSDASVPMGWAATTGKCTYLDSLSMTEAVGNQEFLLYVEDRNEPGAGVDRVQVRVTGQAQLSMDAAVAVTGGNVAVPH